MIEIEGLQKVVGNTTVLDIGHLRVDQGEIAAIVGPAGCGKSQLLEILIGKTQPTVGSAFIGDFLPNKDTPFARRSRKREARSHLVGVLFPEDGLYTRQTARQNLAFHARLFGLEKARIDEVLAQVGLADHADIRVAKLPTGLSRRLAFGRAILHRPGTLILAEPFQRCDEATLSLLTRLIREAAQAGAAMLILADDNANLQSLCDIVYRLNHGRITESYRPQEVQQADLPFKIPVRMEGKVALVNPADILYADAAEGRAYLCTREGHLVTQFTLSELEERLARSGFFRAHRSYLVNLQHVKEVIPYTRNSFTLRLDDEEDTEIPLSKSAAGELRELLGY